MDFELTKHTQDMLKERNIPEEWVWRTINNPDWENEGEDNNIHYFKSITENEERFLHVVINPLLILMFHRRKLLQFSLAVKQGGKNEAKSR